MALVEIPAELKALVRNRRAVAFVGAGFCSPVFPLWNSLITKLYAEAGKNPRFQISSTQITSDPTMAVSLLRTAMDQAIGEKNARDWLRSALETIFDKRPYLKSTKRLADGDPRGAEFAGGAFTRQFQRAECLLSTPWVGIVTTNIDDIIESHAERSTKQIRGPYCPLRNRDSSHIGTLLNGPWDTGVNPDDPWIVHLHGSVGEGDSVLSAEDYEDFYTADRTEGFLTALMLTNSCVFLGCSLDDEILRVRRYLNRRFGKIPPDYALLEANEANKRRREYLERVVGISVILYDGQQDHAGFDEALNVLAKCKQREGGHLFDTVRSMYPKEQSEALDSPNLAMLQLIKQQNGRLTYDQLIAPRRHQIVLDDDLAGITSSERFYRMAFLVHVDLVSEGQEGETAVYTLTDQGKEVVHLAFAQVA